MNIKELIQKRIDKLMSENYPMGAEMRSDSPWAKNTKYSEPITPKTNEFTVLAVSEDLGSGRKELAILQDLKGQKYAFYIDSFDKAELSDYAEREMTNVTNVGEERDFDLSDDWSIDEDVIRRFVNDKSTNLKRGHGLSGWENGADIVLIDPQLKQQLLHIFGHDEKIAQALA